MVFALKSNLGSENPFAGCVKEGQLGVHFLAYSAIHLGWLILQP